MANPIVIRESSELRTTAQPIIREHHLHLLQARILYLFTTAKSTRQGRLRSGLAKRLSPEQRFLSSGLESVDDGYDFMVVINAGQWQRLNPEQQRALLDHELCHCGQKVTVNRRTGATTKRWVSVGHDLEEFVAIVERHGLWNPDVKRLVAAGAQLALPIAPASALEEAYRANAGLYEHDGDKTAVAPGDDLEDVTEESADAATEDLPDRTNGHTQAPDWRQTTGVGQGEIEQHRRRRRAKPQ